MRLLPLLPLLLAGAAFGSVSDDLRRFEGLRLSCYRDTQGFWTVGYGHRCAEGTKMTMFAAEKTLELDISCAEQGAKRAFPTFDSHPQHVKDVLVILTFQIGTAGASKFVKFNHALEQRNYALASAHLIDSRLHKQTPQRCEELADRLINDIH